MSTFLRFVALSLFVVAAMLPARTLAQGTPPDVVRLRDGTFLRGTLVEQSPTRVVIMLANGETRTYPADAVESAGPNLPVAQPPPPVVPAPPPRPREHVARLHVRAEQPRLSLQRVRGTATTSVWTGRGVAINRVDDFVIICNAPCDIEVPEGTYQLAVAQAGDSAVRAGDPTDLRGDMALHLDYSDRSGTRVAALVTFLGGIVGGLVLVLGAIYAGPTLSIAMKITGAVAMLTGLVVGLTVGFLPDTASIDIEPGIR